MREIGVHVSCDCNIAIVGKVSGEAIKKMRRRRSSGATIDNCA